MDDAEIDDLDRWWRAANYLAVGQIYLLDNPLLREPLKPEHIKPRLLGHWGTTPGLNLIHTHLNRVIRNWDLDVIFVAGPGHGGPAMVASTYLEGTYSELYPSVSTDEAGLKRLFRQFSFPGGIGSHVTAETPGSIHEGGELGYSLAHAFGAAFDNPDLLVACVVGDGESETGPLATSWHAMSWSRTRICPATPMPRPFGNRSPRSVRWMSSGTGSCTAARCIEPRSGSTPRCGGGSVSSPISPRCTALPPEWRARWPLRKFGFHGLSHAYIARRVASLTGRDDARIVSCHLGSGASLCAIAHGRSVETTMGFTPLDGLVMATRSGSVDPGLALWLVTDAKMPAAEVSESLERRSGLMGLAGTADMRSVLSRASDGDPDAVLARDAYLHRLRATDGLGFLGVRYRANDSGGDREISPATAAVRAFVIATREDLEIAREVNELLSPR